MFETDKNFEMNVCSFNNRIENLKRYIETAKQKANESSLLSEVFFYLECAGALTERLNNMMESASFHVNGNTVSFIS